MYLIVFLLIKEEDIDRSDSDFTQRGQADATPIFLASCVSPPFELIRFFCSFFLWLPHSRENCFYLHLE